MKTQATVFQAKSGGIYITLGGKATRLSKPQIDDLHISVFELEDFDYDLYAEVYTIDDDDDRDDPRFGGL